jgi:hypothetical protein
MGEGLMGWEKVCERIGVSHEHIKQNKSNAKLLEGSRKLGYHADPIPVSRVGHDGVRF